MGLTGSILVFVPELRRMEAPGWTRVEPSGPPLPIETLAQNLLKKRPGDRVYSVYWDFKPNWGLNFRTVAPNGDRIHSFIDQYRGAVLASIDYNRSPLQWIYDLHADLLVGTTGRKINAWFAFTLAFTATAGLLLWWRGIRHWKLGLRYRSKASWKHQTRDLHHLCGFLFYLPLLLLALSGAHYGYQAAYEKAIAALTLGPAVIPPPKATHPDAPRRSLDEIQHAALAAIPDAEPSMIVFPAKRGDAFALRVKRPSDLHRIGLNWVYVDPSTAQVLQVDRFDQQPLGVRIVRLLTPVHYGTIGGYATRILWIAVGLAPGILFVTSLLMWWNRTRSVGQADSLPRTLRDRDRAGYQPAPHVFLLLLLTSSLADGQTSATATIVGEVIDASGAEVAGAGVELTDPSTGQRRRVQTNDLGQYTVTGVIPGTYKVTASAAGFRQSIVPSFSVAIAKSYNLNFSLEVGAVSETVEVTASAAAELQTLDSAVGAVISGESLLRMPAINRSAMTFFALQPLVIPARGTINLQAGQHLSGQVAGARADQSTFTIDGVDVSDITAGTNFYSGAATDFNGPNPMVPAPAESVQEFRLSTTNTNATYHQSAGGQLNLITKRGSNDFHGSAYDYLQNDALNANRWEYNRTKIKKPALHDNRFGGSLGGPILANKTFFFANYEGRRLPQTAPVNRLTPTATLKRGILQFVDAAGAVRGYDVKAYDPRGLGLSPVVQSLWNRLPGGNNPGAGDGLNTIGFLAPIDASVDSNFAVARLDHIFSNRLRLSATCRYASQGANGTTQVDIAGFAPGHTPGVGAPAGRTNAQPRTLAVQLSANVSSNLLNDLTIGDARNFWADQRTQPRPQVSGSAGALSVAQTFLDQGIDVVAGSARSRVWDNHNYQLRDNVSSVRGQHNIQFGAGWQHINAFHQRDDKIVGTQLTALVYNLAARTAVSIPASARPPTCSAMVTANCLQSASIAMWNDLFAGALGIVDGGGEIAVRDSSLNPLPPFTPVRTRVHWEALDTYFNDVWRVTPSFTLTLGLNWGVQTPPVGDDARQAVPVDTTNGTPLNAQYVFSNRRAAALQGQVWNPPLAWLPIGRGGPDSVYHTDWNNLGPRLAASWNPAIQGGLLGSLLGDRKTVLRGGYSLVYDRINGSTNTFFPSLSVAFAQTLTCLGPRINATCQSGADPSNAFRIGVDGSTIPLSSQLPANSLAPASGNSETASFALDPTLRPGHAHVANFTVQREIGRGFLVEAGYVRHFGRDLLQSVDLNAVPYMMADSASGQSFARAYDAVANYLRGGGAAASAPVQPWFENQLRGASVCAASCTAGLASTQNAAFTQGLLNTLFNVINTQRPAGPITNFQVSSLWMRTNGGTSQYNAGFLSLQRRFANGLAVQANYTHSRSTDQHGYNQEAESLISSGYDFRLDNAPSAFDRTHVFNANFFYELPFGHGRHWANYAVRGWYVAGVYTANSGVPLTLVQSTSAWGGAPQVGSVSAGAIPTRPVDPSGVNHNVAGSNGIGTAGNPATGGSGLNLFADPAATFRGFRPIQLSVDGRNGRNTLRGVSHWNVDVSLGKKTQIAERLSAVITGDFINIFNRVEFVDPALSLQSPASFGAITTQYGTPRAIQLSLRLEF